MSWNSYEYKQRGRKARRPYKCAACGGTIQKGEMYASTYGGIGHEHLDICPPKPEVREEARHALGGAH